MQQQAFHCYYMKKAMPDNQNKNMKCNTHEALMKKNENCENLNVNEDDEV